VAPEVVAAAVALEAAVADMAAAAEIADSFGSHSAVLGFSHHRR
jgi:hypothetical protein